jgi:hypothetical protein
MRKIFPCTDIVELAAIENCLLTLLLSGSRKMRVSEVEWFRLVSKTSSTRSYTHSYPT